MITIYILTMIGLLAIYLSIKNKNETKLRWLIKTLEEDNFGAWFHLTKILLKHPIHKGGIETEIIDKIFKNHIKENK